MEKEETKHMNRNSFQLWVDYSLGKIQRKLTKKEQSEIDASTFAMHLLIPTNSLLRLCNGLQNMEALSNCDFVIEALAEKFWVPKEVMFIKMKGLLQEKPELLPEEIGKGSFLKRKNDR